MSNVNDTNINNEIWKPVKGYEGLYEVSNLGRVRRDGNIIKSNVGKHYKILRLSSKGEVKTFYVHRLVAEAFVANDSNKPMVNHIDGNKLNNSATNLEWCTRRENEVHAWKHGLKEKIRKTSKINIQIARQFLCNKVAVYQMDMEGNVVKEWESASAAMRATGIDASAISKCCRGKLKQSGGYRWRFTGQKS